MKQKQEQSQIQNQILTQFYVYQDLQNFVNLLYSLKEVKEHFKGQNNHTMVKLSRNKVILQMNLSNSIHYDLGSQKESTEILKKEKTNAANILQQLEPDLKEFKEYIEWYKSNCLNHNIYLKQQNLEDTQLITNFNQNVVSQIIPAINSMDEQVKIIQSQKQFIAPKVDEIREKASKFKDHTRESLEQNFPKQATQIQQNDNKQANMKDDPKQIFVIYQNLILKNLENLQIEEKNQYEKIIGYLKNNNNKNSVVQEDKKKYALELYNKKKIKDFHPTYFKFYLFDQFLQFTHKNKNNQKANEFQEFLSEINNKQLEQNFQKHFLQYLFSIQQKQINVDYKSYCDYYLKLQQAN